MHKIYSKNNLIFFVFVAFIFVVIVLQFFVSSENATKVNYHKLFEPISWLHFITELMIMGEIYLPELLSVHVQHCLLLF